MTDIIGEYEDEFNELAKSLKKGLKEYKSSEDGILCFCL